MPGHFLPPLIRKPQKRVLLRLRSLSLVGLLLLLAGLGAWAGRTWVFHADWTYTQANSLSRASRQVLAKLTRAVTITAFVRPDTPLAAAERILLARYHRADPRIRIRYLNPDTALGKMRTLGITAVGTLYLQYGKRNLTLTQVSETGITNALLRLVRTRHALIVFTSGHGEVGPDKSGNSGYGRFAATLEQQGFRIKTHNLSHDVRLPPKTDLVVIAGPRTRFLPTEVKALERWIGQGGNLLWLRNPGPAHGLEPIAQQLGLGLFDGTILDATSSRFGVNNALALVITQYGTSPITRNFNFNTLFPDTTGFRVHKTPGWHHQVLIRSRGLPVSWLVKGPLHSGVVLYRPESDIAGPLPIAIAFNRKTTRGTQRIVVIGNVGFLANSFLNYGGNLNLGLNLFNWLVNARHFMNISPPASPDRTLSLSVPEQAGIGLGFLVGLPLAFLFAAFIVWLQRRRG